MVAVPTGASARTVALVLAVLGYRRRLRRRDCGVGQRCWPIRIGHFCGYGSMPIRGRASTRIFMSGCFRRRRGHCPVLTKQMLMDSFDSVVTGPGLRLVDVEDYLATLCGNELFQGRYFVSATAGTTGRRGVFLWNFREWVQAGASYNRAFDWAGSTTGSRKC